MKPDTQKTVIVACARESCRKKIAGALERAGYRVLVGINDADVLRLIAAGADVVLVSLDLSGAGGLEVCRRIKAEPTLSRIPVVHICGDSAEDARRSLDAGAEAYFRSSIEDGVLVATVEALLRAKRLEEERDRLLLSEQVTLRRQLDETTRLNEQRFRVALRNSPIMVWNQDRDLRYTWVYNLLNGFDQLDPVGKTDEELFPGQDVARLVALKRRVLETEKGLRQEVAVEAGGEVRTLDMTLEPLRDPAGAIVGLTGAAVDLTESKRIEAKLRQTQKLESIGVLAGGVAHDFNNLLTSILGNASLTIDSLPLNHPARPNLDALVQGAERAADLTNQLLAYAGKGQFVTEAVDLTRLVGEVLGLIRSSIPKSVHIHLALKDGLPPVLGDGTQFRQLLMNLVINAGEAIGEGAGTIRVNTGVQELSQYYIERNPMAASHEIAPGTYVYLEVRDTGCGMNEETMARVFDPFFTTKFTGRGLGLAAAQGIVRGHKGTIELYSAPGRGTTFKILLPAAGKRFPTASAGQRREAASGNGIVLVIDDDELVRQLTRAILERRGYAVLAAQDIAEGLTHFRRRPADIAAVLLDAGLPQAMESGFVGALRQMREDIPIVLSSGYPECEVRRMFPGHADLPFIPKPYTAAKLAEVIAAAIEPARSQSETW